MANSTQSCTIIIPTHNRCEYLHDAILTILSQNDLESLLEIVIVDNRSTDETRQIVLELAATAPIPIKYTYESRLGLHYSRHTGAIIANGNILIYIDDDILADPKWLHNLLRVYQDPEVHSAGGRVLPLWESEVPEWTSYFSPDYLSLLDLGVQVREISQKEGINGCNFSIRKETLFRLRGFHPDGYADPEKIWFRGDGESGLIRKVKKMGGKVLYVGDAVIQHRIPGERLSSSGYERLVKMRSISQAYNFLRQRGCSLFSILVMVAGGTGLGFLETLRKLFISKTSPKFFVSSISQIRYFTFARYACRVAQNPDLKKYILMSSYMDG